MKPSEEHISELRPDVRSSEITEISAKMFKSSFRSSMVELCETDSEKCENKGRREIRGDRSKVVNHSWYKCTNNLECKSEDVREDDKNRHRPDDEEILSGKFLVIEDRIESRSHKSDKFLE